MPLPSPHLGAQFFSLSYLYNLLKQSSVSPGVACSDVDDVASDEVCGVQKEEGQAFGRI